MALEYRVLGSLELGAGGAALALGGERQQKLLGLLLVNAGAVVPSDRLVEELWDDPPRTARRQVSNAAVAVRHLVDQVGGGRLVTTTHGYRLEISERQLDVDVFHALLRDAEGAVALGRAADAANLLRTALDLWRGPLLDGLESPSIEAARTSAVEHRLVAVERLAELRLDLGEAAATVAELAGHVVEHPMRESLRALLIRALHGSGRTADALGVFEDGRALLADQLGVDPGPELRALHERLLRSEEAPERPAPGPCFLPFDANDFTGRTAEVDVMLADARAGAPAVFAVEGMGGIGKTALVVHVAHRLLDRYPDGQHFVDLRGFTEGQQPMSTTAALEALLWQSGLQPHQIPADTDARRDSWRARTAGRRVLVVLDNVTDPAQVRDLLPGTADSLVLVTSRRHLVGLDGSVVVPLDALPPNAAKDLFARIASGRRLEVDPAATSAVIRLCGGLPLALRIAASRFSRRPAWTMAHLADLLRNPGGRERTFAVDGRSVAGVIALSHHGLTQSWQRLFRLLGLVPGPDFDARAVAALTGLPVSEADEALDALFEHNLLLQRGPDRYCLHDLVRDCARGMAVELDTEADLDLARHRLFDYYLRFVEVNCATVTTGKPRFTPDLRYPPEPLSAPASPEDAVLALRTEYRNLVAAADHAHDHGWYEHAWQIPCLLQPYFTRVGHRTGVLAMAEHAVQATRALGDRRGEALALRTTAFALREQGRNAEVWALIEQAIDIGTETGDLPAVLAGRRDLGVSFLQAGRLVDAARNFTAARELARTTGDVDAEVRCTVDLALVDCQLGNYEQAHILFQQALLHHQRAGSVVGEAVTMINIGWLDHLRGHDEQAVDALTRAVRLSGTAGFGRGEVIARAWLAVTYRRLGRLEEAISAGLAARDQARQSDLQDPECEALNGLAEAYLAAGRAADARAAFQEAERIALASDIPMSLARAWEGLAHLTAREGEHERARELWERALTTYAEGALDAAHPSVHLASGDPMAVRCTRCQAQPSHVRRSISTR